MKNRQEIILILKRLKGYLRRRYKVKEVGIFGSLIKGNHTPKSDIDYLSKRFTQRFEDHIGLQ